MNKQVRKPLLIIFKFLLIFLCILRLPSSHSPPTTKSRANEDVSSNCELPPPSPSNETKTWVAIKCFKNRIFAGRLLNYEHTKDMFFKYKEKLVHEKIDEYLSLHTLIKVAIGIRCDFIIKKSDTEVIDAFHFMLNLQHYD